MHTHTALPRDALMPRRPPGMGVGALMALLVHGLLVGALALAVNWRVSDPAGVQAELWAAVPQTAAPKPPQPQPEPEPLKPPPRPEPAPPPPKPAPDAQIATEKAKREQKLREEREAREEREKNEKQQKLQEEKEKLAEKKRQDEALKKQQAALDKQREANLKRLQSLAGSGEASSTGTAAQSAGPSASYAGRIKAAIKPNIVFVDTLAGNPVAKVEVRLAPDGRVLGQKLVQSSGSREWDDAVQRAIERTERLPRDVDGRVPASMEISFRPRD